MSSVYTNFREDVYSWIREKYQNYFQSNSLGPKINLYLSRNHIKPGSRSVLNESEILPILRGEGFVVLKGNESLAEIYRLFSLASLVVGPHGSLFANTIFCSSACRVIEFCPKNRIDKSFLRKQKETVFYEQVTLDADENYNISIDSVWLSKIIGMANLIK